MRILAVKTHAFGDALLATPAVRGLIDQGHSVTVVAGPSSLPVWERFPGLSGVVVSPAPCNPLKLFYWSMFHRQKGFDRAIHFGYSPGAKRWTGFISRCEVVSGADPGTGFPQITPAAADYCRIAGVNCGELRPIFPVSEDEKRFVKDITEDAPYAVLAPGGGRNPREFVPEKRWPMERWTPVSALLLSKGLRVFVAGGPDDVPDVSAVPGVSLAGKLTWGQTAALAAGADLFCGNDSGPAHLAVSAGTPSIVLFGPTDPFALYPQGSIVPLRTSADCAPCYSNSTFPGCSTGAVCMESITVEMVLETIEEKLGQ